MHYMRLPFDKIYYIHLLEYDDRYNFIIDNVNKLNLENYKICYTTSLNPLQSIIGEILCKIGVMQFWNDCNKGNVLNELITLYNTVKIAYHKNLNSICILEDDIAFDYNNLDLLNDTMNNIPDDWEILRIHTIPHNNIHYLIDDNLLTHDKPKVVHNWVYNDKYYFELNGTQCFALKRNAMEAFIRECEKLCAPIKTITETSRLSEITDKRFNPISTGMNPDQILNSLTKYFKTYVCYELITYEKCNNKSTMNLKNKK